MKNKISSFAGVFIFLTLACSLYSAPVKPDTVTFKEAYAHKLCCYMDDGSFCVDEYDTWSWGFTGKIKEDFHVFDDNTAIQILIGDFDSTELFTTIAELKTIIDKLVDDGKKQTYGKYKITAGKGGTATYNFAYSYDVDAPNDNTVTKINKYGSLFLKWDKKGLIFKININNTLGDAINGGSAPDMPVTLDPLDDPLGDKPVTVKKKTSGSTVCQIQFGNKLYLNKSLGYSGTKKAQLVFKGPDKDSYVLQSYAVKEIKNTAVLSEPSLPETVNDSIHTEYGIEVNIPVTDNDTSEIEDDVLTVNAIEQPLNGSAAINDDGSSVDYSPNAGFIGKDTFQYTVTDSLGRECASSSSVFVYVGISDPNNAPFAVDDTAETQPGTSVVIDALSNDTDQDDDTLSIVSVTQPENGTVTIKSKKLNYAPHTGYVSEDALSPDTFEYTITDGNGAISVGIVYVFVGVTNTDNPPVAVNDSAIISQDETGAIDVLANDTDSDEDQLAIVAVGTAENGTVTTDGSDIEYTPSMGFAGTDTFTYIVSDGKGGSSIGTVTVSININPVAWIDVAETDENTPVNIEVLANDSDEEDDSISLFSVIKPIHGTAAINGSTVDYTPDAGYVGFDTFSYIINDDRGGTATGDVAVYVGIPDTNAVPTAIDDVFVADTNSTTIFDVVENDTDADVADSLNVMTVSHPANGVVENNEVNINYTPKDGFSGTDSFTYTISDGKGGTSTATVTVIVNNPPLAMPDTATTTTETTVSINVLENDLDLDDDQMSLTNVTQPANGHAVINGNAVEYTSNAGFTGTDTFTYTVTDSKGSFSIGLVTVTVQPKSMKSKGVRIQKR